MKILLLLAVISTVYANAMKTAKEEGKQLGSAGNSQALSQIEHFPSSAFVPPGSENFDPKNAKEYVE